MKKIFVLMFFWLLYGCEKSFINYRAKFLGNFNFIIHNSSYNPINGDKDTTYSVLGEIKYGSENDKVSISFVGMGTSEYTIYEDGTIEGNGCRGEFESPRKINYSCYWASPASHTFENVTGERK